MGEKKETERFVCWINEQDKILSFHYEDGYTRKEFKDKEDFLHRFIITVPYNLRIQSEQCIAGNLLYL